jgi:hypothetical protein
VIDLENMRMIFPYHLAADKRRAFGVPQQLRILNLEEK